MPCPCGLRSEYQHCCGRYIEDGEIASSPEGLMRSRYTAYALGKIDYIKKTMLGKPLLDFNEKEIKQWASSVQWLRLEVIDSYLKSDDLQIGFVEFRALFLEGNRLHVIHEISQFNHMNGCWFYTEQNQITEPEIKISRNDPCPCGSKKKFKHCHAI